MTDKQIFIGIDPGNSGSIAVIDDSTGTVDFMKCKETESDLFRFLSDEICDCPATLNMFGFALIERVSSMPGQGVSSTFKFGQSYGFLRGILIASGIPFEEVTPQKWQKVFGLIRKSKAESNTDKKNRHKAKAQQLFPSVKITHANADALLIAEYCRRTKQQTREGE
jgi:crossover junction endodeoxyribonuclease RuvC